MRVNSDKQQPEPELKGSKADNSSENGKNEKHTYLFHV